MSIQPKPYYRFEDYLAAERAATDTKHEYVAGQVFAMVGATYNHNLITANLARMLGNQLESSPCLLDAYTAPDAQFPLEAIGCTLRLREVYDKVGFAPEDGSAL